MQRHVITLCVYAHQSYVFGRIGLCIYNYVHMWPKNWLFDVLPLILNILIVGVIYYSAKKEAHYGR